MKLEEIERAGKSDEDAKREIAIGLTVEKRSLEPDELGEELADFKRVLPKTLTLDVGILFYVLGLNFRMPMMERLRVGPEISCIGNACYYTEWFSGYSLLVILVMVAVCTVMSLVAWKLEIYKGWKGRISYWAICVVVGLLTGYVAHGVVFG